MENQPCFLQSTWKKKGIFYGKHVSLPDVDPLKKNLQELLPLISAKVPWPVVVVTVSQGNYPGVDPGESMANFLKFQIQADMSRLMKHALESRLSWKKSQIMKQPISQIQAKKTQATYFFGLIHTVMMINCWVRKPDTWTTPPESGGSLLKCSKAEVESLSNPWVFSRYAKAMNSCKSDWYCKYWHRY